MSETAPSRVDPHAKPPSRVCNVEWTTYVHDVSKEAAERDRAWVRSRLGPFASHSLRCQDDNSNPTARASEYLSLSDAAREEIERTHGCKSRQVALQCRQALMKAEGDYYNSTALKQYGDMIKICAPLEQTRARARTMIFGMKCLSTKCTGYDFERLKCDFVPLGDCSSHDDAVARILNHLDMRPYHELKALFVALHLYHHSVARLQLVAHALQTGVEAECARRRRDKPHGNCWLTQVVMNDDTMREVLQWLRWEGVGAMSKVCKEFATHPFLARMKPHLAVRCLPTTCSAMQAFVQMHGASQCRNLFPHAVETLDSGGFVYVVSKKRLCTLLVDLQRCGVTRTYANPSHTMTTVHRNVNPQTHRPAQWDVQMGVHESNAEKRIRVRNAVQCIARRYPDDPHREEGEFRQRLAHPVAFRRPHVVTKVELLYADTKQPVPASRGEQPIELTRRELKKFTQKTVDVKGTELKGLYDATDGVPYPAKLVVTVNALSRLHDGRHFTIRVVAETQTHAGAIHKIEACSKPFKAVYELRR
tara:strand:+ start:1634 stop:3235 length:1602 start_codon:yes stop_codon:yes gene_type:complete